MVTTLRNPLELYVSGQQYLNRKATSTLSKAKHFVSQSMRTSLGREPAGYLQRFVGRSVVTTHDLRKASAEGANNMRSFWLVGLVEQYDGFIAVLKTLVDPWDRHAQLWSDHIHKNASPVSSKTVLEVIEPSLVQQFNSTLRHQWDLYSHAVHLFEERCREVLSSDLHATFCTVPNPPDSYP